MQKNTIEERRQFMLKAGSLLGITVCASSMTAFLSACEKDESKLTAPHGTYTMSLANESGLTNIGDGIKTSVGIYNVSKPVIVVKTGDATYAVFSSVCTHAGCEVAAPKSNGANITCDPNDNHCGHGAQFNAKTGLAVVGPATKGLSLITSSYDAGTQILSIFF